MLGLFSKQNTPDNFWDWFIKNKDDYAALNLIEDPKKRDKVINALGTQLGKYCKHLAWEIGNDPNGDQELIITAEGNTEYFDKVHEIVNNAPDIQGWKITAFKQPIQEHFKSKWEESVIDTKDIAFEGTYLRDTQELGITVYLKNHETLKQFDYVTNQVHKIIDTIIGEESYATDIQYFDLEPVPEGKHFEDYDNILELSNCVAWFKSERQKSS